MVKKAFLTTVLSLVLLLNVASVSANEVIPDRVCNQDGTTTCCKSIENGRCVKDPAFRCLPSLDENQTYGDGSRALVCRAATAGETFGTITPPDPLKNFLKGDPTGAGTISVFLSNSVNLIFSIAAVVLLFMVLWGAFDWMISEGEKEKVAAARSKILNAMIGMILIAIAFAVVRLLSQFTGFTFLTGQNIEVGRDSSGNITYFVCNGPDDSKIRFPGYALAKDQTLAAFCKDHGY